MTRFDDLAECTYLKVRGARLLAVGWLEKPEQIGTNETAEEDSTFVRKLRELIAHSMRVLPVWGGAHMCTLGPCGGRFGSRDGDLRLGSGLVIVPTHGSSNEFYCAPNLVLHYVLQHAYAPPKEFVEAVKRVSTEDVPRLKPTGDGEFALAND